jgi:hypothetical protein
MVLAGINKKLIMPNPILTPFTDPIYDKFLEMARVAKEEMKGRKGRD